jgi:hypothetical protein
MGTVVFALLMAGVLGLALVNVRAFCLAVLVLAGLEMPVLTGETRFFGGVLEVDSQALYMFTVMAGCAIALAVRFTAAGTAIARRPLWLALLLFAAVSLVWTTNVVYGLRMLVKLVTPVLFLWTVSVALTEGLRVRDLLGAALAGGLLALALALVNAASGGALSPLIPVEGLLGLRQLSAPYSSPSNFSFLLSVAAFVSYGLFQATRRVGYVVIAAALVVAVLFALNRAALGGLVLGLIAFHAIRARIRPGGAIVAVLLVLVGVGLLGLSPAFKKRMFFDAEDVPWTTLLTDSGAFLAHLDTSGRNDLWQQAADAFAGGSTLVGSGVGSVDRWIRDRDVRSAELHSDLYRLYLDLGLVGLGLYVSAFAGLVATLVRRGRASDAADAGRLPVERIGLAALVCYFTTLPTDNSINYVTQFGVVVFALAAAGMTGRTGDPGAASAAVAAQRPRRFANVLP